MEKDTHKLEESKSKLQVDIEEVQKSLKSILGQVKNVEENLGIIKKSIGKNEIILSSVANDIEKMSSVLYYIFEHDNPIDDGQTIAGLENGDMNPDIKWNVQYEDSLIQPVRTVIDINMGEYASGTR